MQFIISTGKSRKDKFWRRMTVSWDEFVQRLSRTVVTGETQAEYRQIKKNRQDDIKDVGGFVAGELKNGRRRKENVLSRSMLTLDMDYAGDAEAVAGNLELLYDYACCIYSTHKHTPEKPRLRLIIPLARPVSAEEYQAVSRKLAAGIGIELFDDTTYEPNRLMYWPSTSSDGEYFFRVIEGKFLNPDDILSLYENWRDSSTWPVSSRQQVVMQRLVQKQADPTGKGGLVGTFCRAYTVTEAIEKFLTGVYAPSLVPGRYDYIPADSTAGVVIYENKFAYSHHATDPVCGRLLNAFDLVRLHRFGELDKQAGQDENASYKAMLDFCVGDEAVKGQLAKEREDEVRKQFATPGRAGVAVACGGAAGSSFAAGGFGGDGCAGAGEPGNVANSGAGNGEADNSWQLSLELNRDGSVKNTPTNILTIMRNDPRLKAIAYNEMTYLIDVNGKLPWKQVKPGWGDADFAHLKMYFDGHYAIWSPNKVRDALLTAASERVFHPIRDYFNALPAWDGIERVDRLLIDYLGAEDNGYSRAVIRKTLCAAVARVFEPGIKFDYILVLNGPQGIGKSTFFAKLGGRWFSDSLTVADMRDKAGAEKLQGYWILELGELAGLRKMDVETVKSFITRTDDKFRQSYGINVENHPRQCVIVGSTNSTGGFLRDVTGNRRFWPVRVTGGVKKVWDMTDIDQIWAEALVKYRAGEKLLLTGANERLAAEEQREAMESDDREGLVEHYLETLLPEDWGKMDLYERRSFLAGASEFGGKAAGTVRRDRVCSLEIWCECFGNDRTGIKRVDSYEIESILMRIGGWKRYDGNKKGNMRFPIYNSQRAFIRA
ncbi:Virulence-associated protein E [Sporotomaculum syntrophicum]|uniref:Virulence-associated protein E n=1 Tax=Sporotomaculum syntrophicum TaxID=182264 RepID=A0A9D3AX56_9FIRM|nr:virulence-associated E family protein [Sporotomaculum syntrophicum]KAF1086305.1 Virulence-associated protein E [Sporotomaculum syntrophicum]